MNHKSLPKITGYAAVFNVTDRDGDVILPDTFSIDKISTKKLKLLFNHEENQIIGIVKTISMDHYGLFIECEINTNTVLGNDIYNLIIQQAITALSIGFLITKYDYIEDMRQIIKGELFEISIVTFPANQNSIITTMT